MSGYLSPPPTTASAANTGGKIEPKTVRLEWRGSTGLVYSGKAVNVNATATKLILGDECTVEVENGDRVNAGTYTARATKLSNPNYLFPTTIQQSRNIPLKQR